MLRVCLPTGDHTANHHARSFRTSGLVKSSVIMRSCLIAGTYMTLVGAGTMGGGSMGGCVGWSRPAPLAAVPSAAARAAHPRGRRKERKETDLQRPTIAV